MSTAITIVWICMMAATLTLTILTNRRVRNANKRIEAANERMDVLSRENAKLVIQNEVYRDKLKNLGFSDAHLKL